MESVNTNFKVRLNGFDFPNSFDFPDFFEIKFPLIPTNIASLDDLVYGLCGGMCFSAMDYYQAKLPPPHYINSNELPWPYFLYIWQRQLRSLKGPVIPKLLEWMLSDDITLARKMVRWSIPPVQQSLKSGEPVVLVLVRVKGLSDPTKNHQVLAIGYEYEPTSSDMKILLYDPNFPGEQTELTMNISDPGQGIALAHSKGGVVSGFFPIAYKYQIPPSAI